MKQRGIAIYSTQHRISKLRILADEDKSIFSEGTTLGTLCYEGATVPLRKYVILLLKGT